MKLLQQLTILLCLLTQMNLYSQTTDLDIFVQKYDATLKEDNKGIAFLVKKENKIESLSLGNFSLTPESVFNIGSATKTFTAILLLQEVEKGNIKLTDRIDDFLTPIKNVDGSLTIASLLTHESGLDEVVGKNIQEIFYAKNDSLYNVNLLDQVEANHPERIGSFDYTNTNYFLLGKIIEKVTDQDYFDLIRERILEPLQMNHSYPYVHKNIPNLATPYHEGKDVSAFLDYRFFAKIVYAPGSIASTLSDMELFYTALFETELVLKKETLRWMLESGSASYGLGIFKFNHEGTIWYGHGGNNIGYAFRNEYNPATKELYMMFSPTKSIPLRNAITEDLFAFINNETIESFKTLDIGNFKNYTGTYLLKEANLKLEIVFEDAKLYLVVDAQDVRSELTQQSDTSLRDTVVGATLTKIEGDDTSLAFQQGAFTTTISKITK